MKLIILTFGMFAVAAAQISTEYLPPIASGPIFHAPAPVYHAPIFHAPAPVYHAPAPIFHAQAPIFHAPAPVYHAPSYELPEQEYLPPLNDIGGGHSLSDDGYRYKTAKRFRLRNRRH